MEWTVLFSSSEPGISYRTFLAASWKKLGIFPVDWSYGRLDTFTIYAVYTIRSSDVKSFSATCNNLTLSIQATCGDELENVEL